MTNAEWDAAMAALVACWPDQPVLLPEAAIAWRGLIGDTPGSAVLDAIKTLSVDGERFRPAVGQIIRRALELTSVRIPTFGEAWSEILDYVAEGGRNWTKDAWSHPLIYQTAMELGSALRNLEEGDRATRAHARGIYEAGVAEEQQRDRWGAVGVAPIRSRWELIDDGEQAERLGGRPSPLEQKYLDDDRRRLEAAKPA